jgi:hypothetical protein
MESKGGRGQAADKLQSLTLQDQTIQSESHRQATKTERNVSQATTSLRESSLSWPEPVVVRCGARVIKGYLESPHWNSADEALQLSPEHAGVVFRIRHLESDVIEEVPVNEIKAVFFVSDLNGEPDHNNLRFHALEPIISGIWVQVQFRDGEVIEGIVENSIRFLTEPGFFLRPTDPGGNNKLVYVMKNWLTDHHVLGLTQL